MKYTGIIISLLLFFLLNLPTAAQVSKDYTGKAERYKYWEETVLKFKVLGTASPFAADNETHYENGYGMSISLQFPISRTFSLYTELLIGGIRKKEWSDPAPVSYLKSDKKEPLIYSQVGIRTYPGRADFPIYLKSGLAFAYVIIPIPILNVGAGYDFILSDKISIYPEAEILTTGFKSSILSLSLGISLFH
ncbi:MAG: hypothetical protein PHN88_10125 [Ignavibacteria bacterium]|nr:hypothetical protein [Ignavibacteria bacterium]